MSELETEIAEEMGEEENTENDESSDAEAGDDGENGESNGVHPETVVRSQKEIEELQGKLEREADRHAKRVAEIMGDDFALLVPNPTDWTPGFLFNVPEMLPFPDQVAAFDAIIGRAGQIEFQAAEDAEQCDKCLGLGDVLTGSRKPGQETKPCSGCTGTGWKTKLRAVEPVAQFQQTNPVQPGQPISPDAYQVKDSWGRPAGHPHFGIDPVSIGA